MWEYINSYELYHHGIKGQKWGVRRYQNEDGTLTKAGQKRYANRQKYIEEKEKIIKSNEMSLRESRAALKDLREKGYSSDTWKKVIAADIEDTLGDKDDWDDLEAYEISRKDVYSKYDKNNRDTTRAQLEQGYKDAIRASTAWINDGRAAINNVKNSPIYKKSVAEVDRNSIRMGSAAVVAGAVAPVAIGGVVGGPLGAMAGLMVSPVTAVAAGVPAMAYRSKQHKSLGL